MKYLLLTGGTLSGLGKGTALSSIGVVLKSHGLRVTAVKIDPYLNVDAGTMSAYEYGEVFVLDDGGEVDLDLGNYERFLDLTLTVGHNITSGKMYEQVIKRERTGQYLGRAVQMVPDVTDAIQNWIVDVSQRPVDKTDERPQVCLIELGGTVGDLEIAVFLEAFQQFSFKVGPENFCQVHMGMVPVMGALGEQKTKPLQHSVRLLREAGLRPDVLLCRAEQPLEEAARRKISQSCQVPLDGVVTLHDISSIYRVPLLLSEQSFGNLICRHFNLDNELIVAPSLEFHSDVAAGLPSKVQQSRLADWRILADRADTCTDEISIAVVGKYSGLNDSYISVLKALKHASLEANLHLVVEWVESADLEANTQQSDSRRHDNAWWRLKSCSGVVVPGTFGDRSIEGKIRAAHYCRTSQTPFLGISTGLQAAVIEFARSELGWENSNSTEFEEGTPNPVVIFMPEASATVMGGTLRVGARTTLIKDTDSLACKLYGGRTSIRERHRRRYEVNPQCVPALESKGLKFTGQDDKGQRMEICELPNHPFYFCTQYHPEFKTRPARPAPPFSGFVLAAAKRLERRLQADGLVLRVGSGFER